LQDFAFMETTVERGRFCEVQAEKYFLAEEGRVLLGRNYRCRGGEIDLIFEESVKGSYGADVELVFIEVRFRLNGSWMNGVESVDLRKRRRLSHAIRHFLMGYQGKAKTLRLDILAWDGRSWVHLKNALLQS